MTTRHVMVMQYMEGTRIDRLGDRVRRGRPSASLLMERLSTVYLRMMMMDGFLHADPHPGNLLVAEDGSLVVLDWGAVLEVPRWTRQSLLGLAMAVVREDIDGAIGAMYRLGMIGPECRRGEIREAAAEIVRVVERARNGGRGEHGRVQESVREVLDTFYTWPLMLPRELVYLFRTLVLLEGIGAAYDAHFDSFAVFRRVVGAHRGEILRTAGREPVAIAKDVWSETSGLVRSARELLVRAERENLRVRVHPRDIQGIERSLTLLGRRLLLSIFAASHGDHLRHHLPVAGQRVGPGRRAARRAGAVPGRAGGPRAPAGQPVAPRARTGVSSVATVAGRDGAAERRASPREMARSLAERCVAGERAALARAISVVEDRRPGFRELLSRVAGHGRTGHRTGITGPPGAGKSTLAAALARHWRGGGEEVAVVAVDPTSPYSGGALLGDRVRMAPLQLDRGVFIRSMATRGAGGGLAEAVHDVTELMEASGFERILVETVGVGQTELDVAAAADTVVLVLTPESGDEVQAMKAGLGEVADLFVVNKADRPGTRSLVRRLRDAVELGGGRGGNRREPPAARPPVLATVASAGEGIDAVAAAIDDHRRGLAGSRALEERRFARAEARVRAELRAALEARLARFTDDARFSEAARAVASGLATAREAARRLLVEGGNLPGGDDP